MRSITSVKPGPPHDSDGAWTVTTPSTAREGDDRRDERRQRDEWQEERARTEADDARESEDEPDDHQQRPAALASARAHPRPHMYDARCERPHEHRDERHREEL